MPAFDFYNGEIILIDKPLGWTSFQAVNKIKHSVKHHPSLLVDGQKVKPRVGHAGTLDPLATGLLIVCTGKKTKQINSLMGLEKEYTGTIVLGATTPCFDLEKPVDKIYPTDHISEEMVRAAATDLKKTTMQVPPVFSAIQIGGKRSYDLARAGQDAELKPRPVSISVFEITRFELPDVDFRIVCGKGTYIRSIARDLGIALNSGGHLSKLCRTRIGDYKLEDAVSPDVFAAFVKHA